MKIDEKQVIERIKQGDDRILKYLYDTYYYQLFTIAKQYINDNFTAETIVSDLFCSLWENKANIDIHTSLGAYLVRSVRNLSLNFLRKNYVEKEVCIDGLEATSPLFFQSDEYPLGQLIEKELAEKIQVELNALPKETRDVFLLSRIEELSYEEIAQQLNISVNTVKYHVKQALKILRSKFKTELALVLYYISHFI